MVHKTLRSLFEYSTKSFGKNKAFYFINGDGYTYSEFRDKSIEISRLLSEYGISKGDKVGILSQNMPNWSISFFSVTAFGRVAVPMLPDFSESDIKFILKHSESKALFVSDKLFSKIAEKAKDRLSVIINIDTFEILKGEKVEKPAPEIQEEDIDTEDLCSIIYTSGTTGSSKGVMLSNKNFGVNLCAACEMRPTFEWDVWLSLLPLSHTLENSLCLILPFSAGSAVYYLDKAPTPSILMNALATVRPTTILAVPLIIEKIYRTSILPQLKKSAITRFMLRIPVGRKLLHKVAGKKLAEKFGGRLRFFGIGGAKLNPEVERFLLEGKFPYGIGYGLTETSPLLAGASPHMVRLGSTGPKALGVTLKLINIDPTTGIGEIVAKGENVMMGYYKNPEATAETFTEDGWFRTKDLAIFDKDGWVYIKGRVSNTIIGPSGENIYPEEIESVINSHELVNESIVTENKGGRLTALIHFNQEKLDAFLNSTDEFKKEAQEKFETLKKEILDYVNEKVSKFSRISNIEDQDSEFEKTATQKIKRYLYTLTDKATTKEANKKK